MFDPLAPGFVESPYEQYARLRSAEPVHWSTLLEGWVLTRYADAEAVLRDAGISSDMSNANPTSLVLAYRERQRQSGRATHTLVLLDDPDHGRLRRLMQQPFGPRAIERLRASVQQRVDEALDALVEKGEMDVVADFAYPLPVAIFCEMLGIPDEDSPRFRAWTRSVAEDLDPLLDEESRRRNRALFDEMETYLVAAIEDKKRRPADDMLTAFVQAEDDGARLSRDELVAQLVTLYVAGHEPTAALVANGLLALLRQPEQLARLRARPELVPNAVQELLRYDGPNQFVRRVALGPMTLADREIGAGDVIYVCIGAANRDPERWGTTAGVVDVERSDAAQHLQFGMGVHTCLGSHLARLQAEIALGALVARLDDLELAGAPVWSTRMVLRAVDSLPVRFTARAAAS